MTTDSISSKGVCFPLGVISGLCRMNLTVNEFRVLMCICKLSWGDGNLQVACTNYHLSYESGLDVKKVSTAINKLIERNMLTKEPGINKAAEYYRGQYVVTGKRDYTPPVFTFTVNMHSDTWIFGLKLI